MPTRKILIVDDHDEGRQLLMLCVKRLGYEVAEAINGFEALDQVAENKPDLILMDLFMPRMDGQEAISRLQADPCTKDIPILILTASNDAVIAKNALRAGGADVLIKPLDLLELGHIIARYMGQKHTTPKLIRDECL